MQDSTVGADEQTPGINHVPTPQRAGANRTVPEKRGPLGSAPYQLRPRPLGLSPLPTHTAWTWPTSRLAGPWGSRLGPSHSSYPACTALGLLLPRILAERSPPHGRCPLIPVTRFRSSSRACEAPRESITSNLTPV